ncbi:MAG TPA: Hsp20/alpha crystallin family protein [Mycobacteriales bacterium]|nr:Hsp20/alpha crystallin family protein [Mycobacteriales bacterium]
MDIPVHGAADFDGLRDRLLADLDRWPELVEDAEREHLPRTQVQETATAWLVDVDLPGVAPADVRVEVAQGELVVSGRRRNRHGRTDGRTGAEGEARVALTLPVDADADAITAELELGVLSLVVPRRPAAGPRRIPVRRVQR